MSYKFNFAERLILHAHYNHDLVYRVKDSYIVDISKYPDDGYFEITKSQIKMVTDFEKDSIIITEDKKLIKQIRKTVGGILCQKEQEYQEDQKAHQTQK